MKPTCLQVNTIEDQCSEAKLNTDELKINKVNRRSALANKTLMNQRSAKLIANQQTKCS